MTDKIQLDGLSVLVVEDAFLIALDLSDYLESVGCHVIGPASTVRQALDEIANVSLDGAVLDVNLEGEQSFPVAEYLASLGVPFIFLTGYDSAAAFPDEFHSAPRLSKPVELETLADAVSTFRKA
jgi:two-component SAPR family response regulator